MALVFTGCAKPIDEKVELTSLGALFQDQKASALIKAEKYEEALAVYVDMLEKEPESPEIHSNIGVIMAQTQKPEDALKSLEHALELAKAEKNPVALFGVQYNLGVYFGGNKKIDEALQHYQAALDIVPDSKETKTNIELLIQMNQQNQGQGDNKDQKQDQQQNQSKDQQNKDGKDGQDKKDDQKDKQNKDDPKKDDKDKDQNKDQKDQDKKEKQSSAKYKPRPYQGDQLSEGDVKKILGELRNQEQKIRANFDKKEQKDSGHEKDW
jgi:Ca-activated chloride channel family protein